MRRQLPLFEAEAAPAREVLGPGAVLLRRFVSGEDDVLAAIAGVVAAAPFRHMTTPGGFTMSVAMTSCGRVGWVSDARGYRYSEVDPETGKAWPAMPPALLGLAVRAADEAGYPGFVPDACLVNRYVPGARMTLHQDKDERDFAAPIVSVSLGLPATFLFGGATRDVRPLKVPLEHGDVVVWGGPSRLYFHGVEALPEKLPETLDGMHAALGAVRINLTFRVAR